MLALTGVRRFAHSVRGAAGNAYLAPGGRDNGRDPRVRGLRSAIRGIRR